MIYDYLIVGSGFFGSICARELTNANKSCLVIEKRSHIGGNCYTENRDDINVHIYGPHIFHTSNEDVWRWINQYAEFNNFSLRPVANYKGEIYSLPFNMWTFSKLWNISTPEQAKLIIESQSKEISEINNLEDQAIKTVGRDVYEKLIKGYTEKQWKRSAKELPKEIIKRLPVRFTYDNNYFNDKYQGIPIGGYTKIFEKLLTGIKVVLNTDYLKEKNSWNKIANKVIYTGPIDRYFDYCYGPLDYKTTKFDHMKLNVENFQGVAMVNYTDSETPYTRIIEHKHFECKETNHSWVTWEYPVDYQYLTSEPYYPVNDDNSTHIYNMYNELSKNEQKLVLGGRLAEYKYYDMDKVIETALQFCNKELNKNL